MQIDINDVSFNVVEGHHSYWQRIIDGTWEPQTLAIFDRYVTSETTVLDVGAFIGPTAMYAAHRAKRVFAFEPNPVAFQTLVENLKVNPTLDNLEIFNVCVAAASGTMRIGTNKPETAGASILRSNDKVSWEVPAIRLEHFIKERGISGPIFIKMDIEGYEYELIPTLANFFKSKDITLYLSMHPHRYKRFLAAWSPNRSPISRLSRSLKMMKANLRLIETLRNFKYIYDSHGYEINLVMPKITSSSLTNDDTLIAAHRDH